MCIIHCVFGPTGSFLSKTVIDIAEVIDVWDTVDAFLLVLLL